MRLGRTVTQTPAHAPTTDARRVSITCTGMNIEMENSAFGKSLEQEERYNPFQGIDGLEGCSLTGLGSALSRQKTLVVRGVGKMVGLMWYIVVFFDPINMGLDTIF